MPQSTQSGFFSLPCCFGLLALLVVSPGQTTAGQLSRSLTERIAVSSADQPIRVVISLTSEPSVARYREEIATADLTREERYRLVSTKLRAEHNRSQAQLVASLRDLQKADKLSNLKQHWLANIVTAEISMAELTRLAARSDVDFIQEEPIATLIEPTSFGPAPALSTTVESNLTYIRAPQAWALGYTGKGRLVCSFDTGVNGEHSAIKDRWNGRNGDSAASWYDPVSNQRAPHTFSGSGTTPWHGSHVMGIMVGRSGLDTIGVAPDANWISAGVIDIQGASIVDAFEWAANPDGDFNTVGDLPDVINHSWGIPDIGCVDPFFELIDNIEALGVVNIFAAGNEGSSSASIRNPAIRANDSIDCFAVGNIEHAANPVVIAPSSSRGPSLCDGTSKKPNVAAPGTGIRSINNVLNGYQSATGTSMATPHVSGLVALMREKNPNASVQQIKTALLTSATPLGPVPNNNVGWGVIDCVNALNALPAATSAPNVRVYSFEPNVQVAASAIIDGRLILQNLGGSATNVRTTVTAFDPLLSLIPETTTFGSIASNDTLGVPFIRVCVSAGAVPGSILTLDLTIEASGFSSPARLYFKIEPEPQRSQVDLTNSTLQFTVSNYGVQGLGAGSIYPLGGRGFRFAGGPNELYESGLVIGRSANDLVSAVHEYLFEPTFDFKVAPGGSVQVVSPGPVASHQTSCVFEPKNESSVGGVQISQETFLQSNTNTDIVWIRYIVSNPTSTPVTGLYLGQYLDWDANNEYNRNAGGWESAEQFLWTALNTGSTTSNYRCAKLVEGQLSAGVTSSAAALVYTGPNGGDGYTAAEKLFTLTAGTTSANTYRNVQIDICQTLASGPHTIPAGESDTVIIALFGAASLSAAREVAGRAAIFPSGPGAPPPVPVFELCQNYPNPFNPQTTFEFAMPKSGDYSITIFNLLGQQVDRLTGQIEAGTTRIVWDAGDRASGVYLYKIEAEGLSATRKMLLVR